MLVKRLVIGIIGSSLLTVLLVWAHECQRPRPNCDRAPSPGSSGRCPDGKPCTWKLVAEINYASAFCSKKSPKCPNHNPAAGPCSERIIWRYIIRVLACKDRNGNPCKSATCIKNVEEGESTGTDCQGHPCQGHPRIGPPEVVAPVH